VASGTLRLFIERDQEPWSPEFCRSSAGLVAPGPVYSRGPVGSAIGQHRFREGIVVREEQRKPRVVHAAVRPVSSSGPRRARRSREHGGPVDDSATRTRPAHSAEICVCEIFGRDVGPLQTRVGMGVHPFGDPAITDEFAAETVDIDARGSHTYAAEWTPDNRRLLRGRAASLK